MLAVWFGLPRWALIALTVTAWAVIVAVIVARFGRRKERHR
jgi:hypothetical protein